MRGTCLRALMAAALITPLLPVSARATDGGVTIVSVVTAADYLTSHTVYAVGSRGSCTGAACTVLLRSRDGGDTWSPAAASGWEQRTVLAVSIDGRPVLLSGINGGYAVSLDGGDSFQAHTAPGPPTAAASRADGVDMVMTGSDGSSDYLLGLPGTP